MVSRKQEFDIDAILQARTDRFRISDFLSEDVSDTEDERGHSDSDVVKSCEVLKLGKVTETINSTHMGVNIFDSSLAGHLFDEAKLNWEFREPKPQGMSSHPVFHISSPELHELILGGMLKKTMENQVIYNRLNKYMFSLMSCHSSENLVAACCGTLIYHQMKTTPKNERGIQLWIPSLDDIIMEFSNFGAPKEMLASWDYVLPHEESISTEKEMEHSSNPGVKNVSWVLKVITSVLVHHRTHSYSIKELNTLLCVILTISLDKNVLKMESSAMRWELSKCVKSILQAYPSSVWQKKGEIASLSKAFCHKMKNVPIGNIYIMVTSYIICSGFGEKLAPSLMHGIMMNVMSKSNNKIYLDSVEAKDIAKMFNIHSLLDVDYYTQYYFIMMLDNIIGNIIFTEIDEQNINKVRQLLLNLEIRSPHSEKMVDFMTVKGLISRVAVVWELCMEQVKDSTD